MTVDPCRADLNAEPPGGVCTACGHRVLAHDLGQVCAACDAAAEVVEVLGPLAPDRRRRPTGAGPSSAGPEISTR